ncbi:MAG: hypothetical protein Q4E57_04945 [Eubacteriales bacterium]|nr:hypothetical protein [Eubacteriales bacterium]
MKNKFRELLSIKGDTGGADVVGVYDNEKKVLTHVHAVLEEQTATKTVYLLNLDEYPFIEEMLDEADLLDVLEDGFRLVFNRSDDIYYVNAEVGKQVAAELNPVAVFDADAIDESIPGGSIPMYVLGLIYEYYNSPEEYMNDRFNLKFFFRCMYDEPTLEDNDRMRKNLQLWTKAMGLVTEAARGIR